MIQTLNLKGNFMGKTHIGTTHIGTTRMGTTIMEKSIMGKSIVDMNSQKQTSTVAEPLHRTVPFVLRTIVHSFLRTSAFAQVALRLVLLLLLLPIAFMANAGSSTTYYSKVSGASVPATGAGTVYVVKGGNGVGNSTATSATQNSSSSSSSDTHTYSIKATPANGYAFKSWSGTDVTISSTNATQPSTTCTISVSSTNQNSPTEGAATATFVKVFQFKAEAGFVDGSSGLGDVYVSFTNGTPAYQAAAMEAKSKQNGAEATTANATQTAYFKAQVHTGTEFRGWYSDAAGDTLKSTKLSYSQDITSDVITEPSSPQLTLYAKFEKVPTTPSWELAGTAVTTKTLTIGETIGLITETAGDNYEWGTPTYVDAGETNPVMTYNPSTKTFTANRAGTVTIRFTQTAGEDANGVLWIAGEETFTFTVKKRTPQFAWADPLPNFVVGTTLPVSDLFSFTPAESEQNWTLTSDNVAKLPSVAAPTTGLSLPNEVNGVTLTFHQNETWEWEEIKNTSIKINVTKEPVVFNWKNPALIAGNTYSWTDFVETNSAGAWNLVSDDESVIPTMRSIASTSATVAAGMVTLTFTQGADLGHDAVPVQTKTFRVYPADGLAQFKVGSTYYNDLNAANTAASSASNKTIVVAQDGVLLPGDYTISNGVKLYIPYSTSETSLTAPAYTYFKSGTPDAPSCYRKLTFLEGANITVNSGGVISVGGQIASLGGGSPSGYPFGACGVLDMSNGGHIELQSGSILYAWGFIKGQDMDKGNNTVGVGTITANGGSKVYEDFCGENRGGSACSALASDGISYKSFPFQGYAIQNIEVPVTYKYQSTLQVYAAMYIQGDIKKDFPLISSSGSLFLVQNNTSYVKKWYDPTTDLACYELSGTAKLDAIKTTIYVTVNSADFNLPISSNMHIILDNCTMNLANPVQILPDAVIEIRANSTATISSNLFLYDKDDWKPGIGKYYFASFKNLTVHKDRGDGTSNATLNDAKLIVDGTLNVTGKLYSTTGGANICGNGGGKITLSSLPTASNIYQCWGKVAGSETYEGVNAVKTFSSIMGGKTYLHSVSVNSANLHNEDNSYTKSVANKTFYNIHGRWFVEADKDPKTDHTYSFTYLNNGNTGSNVNTPAVYTSSKTELMAGYKWVNVALDNDFCGNKTFKGIDGHYYYYNSASTDAVSKWVQLVKLSDALYSGSDNNLYTFTGSCSWASVGEIDENCMYTIEGVKKALVGTEFVALEKDEYDEVYVNVDNHSDYYMLFSGCVWQHATKIPDTYRAYEVLGNPYIWLNDEWTQVDEEYGYYYTTDEQNLKHYYEFDVVTFSWRPAKERVRITTATERRDFLTWDHAMMYLGQYTNPTVTLLDDAVALQSVATLAPGSKSTQFTFDLNGHTLTANIGSEAYFMNMNTSATLYITDNSDRANGQMLIYGEGNKEQYGILVTVGNVVMNGGRIYMENASVYKTGYTACKAYTIYLKAGQSLTINGGELEAKGHRNVYGVYAASSAATATKSIITMNGGKVTATAPNYAYGIGSTGIINMNGGTVDAKTEAVTSAGGTTAAGSYAYGIYGHISVSAADASSYYSTINMTGGTVNATAYSQYAYGVFGNSTYTTANGKKSDNTTDNAYKSTDGTYSNKASCKLNITGGVINAIAQKSTQSYGIYSAGTYNSYKDYKSSKVTITPHVIKNVKIFSQATGTAYGILMSAQTHEYSGGLLWGEAVIDNADVYAETTVSTGAYAVYASAANIWTNRARYSQVSASNKKTWYVKADNNDGDVTHEGISATDKQVYQYQIGCHVAGAKITINSGNYRAKSANNTTAAAVYCNRSVCTGDPTGNTVGIAEVVINGGTFTSETMTDTGYGISNGGITTINGGTINVHTGTGTAYGVYGWAGTLTLNSGVVINSTVETTGAYGVAANGWIDGNTGMHTHGTVIVNEGVIVNATSPNSSTAYGAYALAATSVELNQTKYDARTEANRKNYYAVNEEGTTVTNAITANYFPYRFGTYVEGGEITINGGTFNVKTFTSTAIGAVANLNNLVRTTELGRIKVGRGVLNVYGGTFNIEAETSSTAEGIRSYGLTHVYDGTFNIQTKTTTAYGVCARDGETIIDGGTFNVTAGTTTAVGASAWADDFNTDYGYYYTGALTVNGGTFNVRTWNGSDAYGVQVRGKTNNFAAAKVKIDGVADAKKDYAIAGTATVNGGTFIMTPSNGTKAYSTHVYTTQTSGTATATPTCYIKGGFFQTNGTTTSGMYVSALKENNVVTGGHFSDKTGLTSTTATKNYVNAPYAVINCVEPEYKDTYPYEVGEPIEITFVTDNGETLWSGKQPKGHTAIYPLTNGIPERASDATHSYEFAGWDKALAEVTEPTTYTANFNAVGKKFMITWVDDKGIEIDHKEYTADEMPEHADPVKEGYDFKGWTPAMYAVNKDQTYTAKFEIKKYTIKFVDEDGTVLKEQTVNHGTTPTKPTTPTKDGYSFSAWNPGIVKATEDATYTATYLLNIASVTTSAGKTTPYTSWATALKAANGAENSTLTVLTDVGALGSQSIIQTFTLDLNGHTLSGTANKLINVNTAGKTLTIRDSQGGGKIEAKAATAGQLVAIYVTKGNLNIESGYIRAENLHTTSNASYYGCGVLVSSGYVCNMSGGTVEGITNINLAYGLCNNGGTVTITGGTINAQAQNTAHGVLVKGNTTITNAVVSATTTRTTTADAFYVTAATTLTINSGVFTANAVTTDGYAIAATAAATITVNDGKFKSTTKTVSNTGGATIKLNAGFYDTDTELAGYASPKKVVALTTEPEKAEGYNYKIVDNAHQVTFKNEDGSVVLQQSNIEDDVQPVYHGEAQTKASTPKYSYSFDGWKDASDGQVYAEAVLPAVSKDVVYTAHFVQSGVEYPITFTNIDGLGNDHVQFVAYGEMPVYDGATPYMSGAVENYAYTFIGWDPELAVVEGPATYTPRYNLVISHKVSFVINNASATTPATLTVAEGAAVERPADQLVGCQHIAGWYKNAALTDEWNFATDKLGENDLTLYAKWETKTYTITWLDESGDVIDQTTVDCGAVPTHESLYKPSTAAFSYEWKGWNKTLVAANGDATYKSLGFTQVAKRYAITFVTGAGATVINPIEQEVGTTIVAPADPIRAGYTFNGWIPEVPSTMPANDVQCVAQWIAITYIYIDPATGAQTQQVGGAAPSPATYQDEDSEYTFDDWDKDGNTYTARYAQSERFYGELLDVVDWTNNSIVVNTNGLVSTTAKANWTIIKGEDSYTKANREADRRVLLARYGQHAVDDYVVLKLKGTSKIESRRKYTVPHIYDNDATLNSVTENSVIYVHNGATLTVNDNTAVSAIYVSEDASLIINAGAKLTVNDRLVLRTKAFHSANLIDKGEIIGQVYYSRIVNDKSQMYEFALPFDVKLSDVTVSSGKKADLGNYYALMYYDSESRAANGKGGNWKAIDATTTDKIIKHTGYQLLSSSAYYYEFMFPITYTKPGATTSVEVKAYSGSGGANSQGWNFICSPFTETISCPEGSIFLSYLDEKDNETFIQEFVNKIQPARPFYYQAGEDGTIDFTTSDVSFVKKTSSNQKQQTQWIQLYYSDDKTEDEANIRIDNDFSPLYEVGRDVEKLSLSGNKVLIYTSMDCGNLALASVPDSVAAESIALTVYNPKAGESEFALNTSRNLNRLEHLWLEDKTADVVTDLLQDNYTCFVSEGTTANRFFLYAAFREEMPEVATDNEDVEIQNSADITVIGRTVYANNIQNDLYCYDAVGKLVGVIKSDMGNSKLTLPAAGIYLIKGINEVRKIVVNK